MNHSDKIPSAKKPTAENPSTENLSTDNSPAPEQSNRSHSKTEDKREAEQRLVSEMIALYCKRNHHPDSADGLCDECRSLDQYARARSSRCPFMETKTFCSNCPVHCYKPEMREKIRKVMRWSGPRMIFHHPVIAVRHVIEEKKEKRRLEKTAAASLDPVTANSEEKKSEKL